MAVMANGAVEGDLLPEEIVKLLTSLGAKWGDVVDLMSWVAEHLSGAMTNEVYKVSWRRENQAPRAVLVRRYGKGVDVFFDREEEIRTFEFLSSTNNGPKLLGKCSEGRVEQFIYARTLSATDLCDPNISALIATKMGEFHKLDMPGSNDVVLWSRMRKWLGQAKRLCSLDEVKEFHLENMEDEISLLEKAISNDKQKIGFCHNDLQYGNIMIKDSTITVIDYEYASYNPIAYDIANHFCEMAANYHTDTPHILDYDNKYPGMDHQKRFIRQYLTSAGHEPNDKDVNQLAVDVEKYSLASHLFWGLWGLISHHVNQIDFDYMEYARQRFNQYQVRKPEILSVQKVDSS